MKTKKLLTAALVFILITSMLTACGGGNADKSPSGATTTGAPSTADSGSQKAPSGSDKSSSETYTLRIGTGTGGVHPQNVWMEAFEAALEKETNNRIDVQLYPAGQLGNMAELIQGLRDGTVDSVCIPTTYFATTFPTAATVDLSFMFKDSEQLWQILTNNDTLFEKEFIDNGIIPIAWLRAFERTIICSSKLESMADLKNKKIWCMPSTVIQKEVELLGAITSNMDVGELAPSLQNGTVDGAISDVALYVSQSLQTSAKYLLNAPRDALISVFAVSPVWYNKIPDDLKEVVKTVANQVVKETEYPYVSTMQENALKKMTSEGLQVIEPSESFMNDMKASLAPQHQWFLETYPQAKPIYDELKSLANAN